MNFDRVSLKDDLFLPRGPLSSESTNMNHSAKRHSAVRLERNEPRLLFAAHVAGSSVAYSTIQAAVNAAPVGGTVTVDAGTYAEQVTISKSLTIDWRNRPASTRASAVESARPIRPKPTLPARHQVA